MTVASFARSLVEQEARALATRLERMKPFAMYETMVPAAAPSVEAQAAIERSVAEGRAELRQELAAFLRWIRTPEGLAASPAQLQRRFTVLRMQFNVVLSQFDIFAEAVTQRSEADTGVWLSGLDALASEALALPGYYEAPPVVCYLERGLGAAIRRAHTRIPGGKENPIALVRVPRERMIGSGVASSLVHEVGHQGAALLDLVDSLRQAVGAMPNGDAAIATAWALWSRWLSEVVADFWAVSRLGITATVGLMAVVSLPRFFVTRININDPHPTPWIRVKLSCAIGHVLYPDPQWATYAAAWERLYPIGELDGERRQIFALLDSTMPTLAQLIANHRPRALRGASLAEALASPERQPGRLRRLAERCRTSPITFRDIPPSLVFAALGQARLDGTLSPEEESRLLGGLLSYWALRSATDSRWAVHGAVPAPQSPQARMSRAAPISARLAQRAGAPRATVQTAGT